MSDLKFINPKALSCTLGLLLSIHSGLGCAPTPLPFSSISEDGIQLNDLQQNGGATNRAFDEQEDKQIQGNELDGLWKVIHTTTTIMTLPVVMEEIVTTITAELSLDIRQEGEKLWISSRTCSVESLSEPNIGQRLIPQSFVNAIGSIERRGRVWRQGEQLKINLERSYELRGVLLDDPINDALPTSADDPRIIDLDRDGHPGLTVTLTGFPAGDVYLIQRTWDEWEGSADESLEGVIERLSGTVTWDEEQSRLGATNDALLLDIPQIIPKREGLQTFEMLRVTQEDAGCLSRSF